ncbi:olfactory receptor 1500-like [Gastrophryne carolinensis]
MALAIINLSFPHFGKCIHTLGDFFTVWEHFRTLVKLAKLLQNLFTLWVSHSSNVTIIVFLGFRNIGKFNLPIFILILLTYFGALCGNLLIITLVSYSKTLHTPMYMLLSQLSVSDIMLSTTIAPNLLNILLYERTSISFSGCITQFYFFVFSVGNECFLLMVMAYDRYLAICYPLRYFSIMTQVHCMTLILACWLLGFSVTLLLTLGICQLQFCGPNIIDHFFCDFDPLLKLSCSDTSFVQIEDKILGIPMAVIPCVGIGASYIKIATAILRITSLSGRQKAFGTCSSHLTVVCLYYGTLIAIYMVPTEGQSQVISKALSMLYSVVTPFLNSLIYSLKNKAIKDAVRNAICNK